jgi:hypothetical protein
VHWVTAQQAVAATKGESALHCMHEEAALGTEMYWSPLVAGKACVLGGLLVCLLLSRYGCCVAAAATLRNSCPSPEPQGHAVSLTML